MHKPVDSKNAVELVMNRKKHRVLSIAMKMAV